MLYIIGIILFVLSDIISLIPVLSSKVLDAIMIVMGIAGIILLIVYLAKNKPDKKLSLKLSAIIMGIGLICIIINFIDSYLFYKESFNILSILQMNITGMIINRYTILAFVYLIYSISKVNETTQIPTQTNPSQPVRLDEMAVDLKPKKLAIWYILLVIGLLPWAYFIIIVVTAAFDGFSFLFSDSAYGLEGMGLAFVLMGINLLPVLAIGLVLIIISLVKIVKNKKYNKNLELIKNVQIK